MALDFTTGIAALQGDNYGSSLAPSLAFQVWFNADALAGHLFSLFDSANTPTDYEQFKITGGNLVFEFNDGTAIGSIVTAITSNTWYHALGLVKANNNRELWLDGTCVGTAGLAVAPSARNRVIIGKFGAGTDYDGRIAETAIWSLNSDFDSADIAAAAAGYTPRQVRVEEAFSYWSLLEAGPWTNQFQTEASSLDLFTDGTTPVLDGTHPPVIPFSDGSFDSPYWGLIAQLTGVATVGAVSQQEMAGVLGITGIGTVGAVSQMNMALLAQLTGIGSMFANLAVVGAVVTLGSGLTGIATVGATATMILGAQAALTGTAIQAAYPGVNYASRSSMVGRAFINAQLYQYRNISNPPLSGDGVPISNQARFLLTVNTTPVDLSSPYFNVEDMDFSYDGKSVSFSEIATPTIGRCSFAPEGNVKLQIDFNDGEGLITYFTGQINRRTHEGINNAETIRYNAEGIQTLANRVTLLNTTGRPELEFTVGTTVITIIGSTEITTTFAKSVKSACFDLFTIMSSVLNANSISSAIHTPSFDTISAQLPETVQFSNLGFAAALQELLDVEPGKKWYWDDTIQKWTVVDLVNAPILLTRVESSQLTQLVYDMSTEGRYTAIRLMANLEDAIDDNLITKTETLSTPRGAFSIQQSEVTLIPNWNPSLQSTWNYFRVFEPTSTDLETDYFWVFRRWSFPKDTPEPWPGTPVKLKCKQLVATGPDVYRWERFKGRVNWKRHTVIAANPLISRLSNPYTFPEDPGTTASLPPEEVVMTYYPRAGIEGTVVTSTDTFGNQTTVNTTFDSAFLLSDIRYPYTGFEGTAKTMFGVQRELIQLVSKTEVTTENARARLSLLKDVIISGDLPFAGDPVKEFINLGRTVNVAHATKDTGIATINVMQMGYRYTFGHPGSNQVRVSTDRAAITKGS